MSISIYSNGKWYSLAKTEIYSNGDFQQLGDLNELYINGEWYKLGYETLEAIETEITFQPSDAPSSSNIIYFSVNGNGNKDGTSFNNAHSIDELQVVLNRCNVGDSIYFLSGTYFFEFPINIPDGINFYGGFNFSNPSFNKRNPFTYPAVFQMNMELQEKFSWSELKTSHDFDSIIDGFVINDYTNVIIGQLSNTTFKNCIFNRITNGVFNCNLDNCAINNSNVIIQGNINNIKNISKSENEIFNFDCRGNITNSTFDLNGNFSSNENYSITNCLLKIKGQSDIHSLNQSFIYNCGYTVVENSIRNVYYHTSIEINDSSNDRIIFNEEGKDITINNALKDEISGRKPVVKTQGLTDKYSTLVIDSKHLQDSIFFNYLQANSNEYSNYLIVDSSLYYEKDLIPVNSDYAWEKVTGFSKKLQENINNNGTYQVEKYYAYGIANKNLYLLDCSTGNTIIRNLQNNEGGINWTELSGKFYEHRSYAYNKTLDLNELQQFEKHYAYGICEGKLYAFNDIEQQDQQIIENDIVRISDLENWTAISGFSKKIKNRNNQVNDNTYAYGICDKVLYAIHNGTDCEKVGMKNNQNYGWTAICGYSVSNGENTAKNDNNVYAYGICNGKLYSIEGNVASLASTLDGWTQISGSSKDNGDGWSYSRTYEANGHRKDFNTYGTYYRGYALGICNEDLYYLDRFNAIKIDENVDCICGELRENQNGFYLKNNELYKIYFETEPIYYNEQIYYDEQEHKSYYASVQYGTSFVVKKQKICNYNGKKITSFNTDLLLLNYNKGNFVNSAEQTKFLNCQNIYVAKSQNCLYVNCENKLFLSGTLQSKDFNFSRIVENHEIPFEGRFKSYTIFDGKLYYGNDLEICDNGSDGWTEITGYSDDDTKAYGIKDTHLYLLNKTEAILIDSDEWNKITGFYKDLNIYKNSYKIDNNKLYLTGYFNQNELNNKLIDTEYVVDEENKINIYNNLEIPENINSVHNFTQINNNHAIQEYTQNNVVYKKLYLMNEDKDPVSTNLTNVFSLSKDYVINNGELYYLNGNNTTKISDQNGWKQVNGNYARKSFISEGATYYNLYLLNETQTPVKMEMGQNNSSDIENNNWISVSGNYVVDVNNNIYRLQDGEFHPLQLNNMEQNCKSIENSFATDFSDNIYYLTENNDQILIGKKDQTIIGDNYVINNGNLYYLDEDDVVLVNNNGNWNTIYGEYAINNGKLYHLNEKNIPIQIGNNNNFVTLYDKYVKDTNGYLYYIQNNNIIQVKLMPNSKDFIINDKGYLINISSSISLENEYKQINIKLNKNLNFRHLMFYNNIIYAINSDNQLYTIIGFETTLYSQENDWITVNKNMNFNGLYAVRKNNLYPSLGKHIYKITLDNTKEEILAPEDKNWNFIYTNNNKIYGAIYEIENEEYINGQKYEINANEIIEKGTLNNLEIKDLLINASFEYVNNIEIELPMNYQYFTYSYNGAGLKNNKLYMLGNNENDIIEINNPYQISDIKGYLQNKHFVIDNEVSFNQGLHDIYAVTNNNKLIEINYNDYNELISNQGIISQVNYNFINDKLYALISNKLYDIKEHSIIIDEEIDKYGFDKNHFYYLKNNNLYSDEDEVIRYETKDIISLPNANYIYGVTKNDKLIKIQNKSYENINIIKNNEKIISITCFGNDDIAMEKYQVSDLTAKANLCTYAGCIGNVLYGYGNIYWNSEGNIPFDYNGTDIYNQNNIITFGVHEVGDNSVPQFIDIGYASVKGRINDISECPYIPALTEQGISEYQTWIDNMGCFIPKKDSILRAPINLFNQKDVFGASITVDLNGNPRTDLTIIGCYDFIEQNEEESDSE